MAATETGPGPARVTPRDQLLVVQATPFCNIDCRYCYLATRDERGRRSLETFERVVARVTAAGIFRDEFTICWHAGEPLTVPVAFYRSCVAIAARYASPGLRIRHNVQTNGTLLTPEWCAFFREAGIAVGVSVDGPASLHNGSRVDRSGRGTFARVERGLALLREHDVPFSAICVLTFRHLSNPQELHEFFTTSGAASVSFNIDEIEGPHDVSSFQASGAVAHFTTFLTEILRLNRASARPLRLPNLDVDLLQMRGQAGNHQVRPWNIVSVDHRGNLSTFSPELMGMADSQYDDFVFGNVFDAPDGWPAPTPALERTAAAIAGGVERCRRECAYFDYCGGGAPANKYFELGTFEGTETLHCRIMRKAVLDVNLANAEATVARARERDVSRAG